MKRFWATVLVLVLFFTFGNLIAKAEETVSMPASPMPTSTAAAVPIYHPRLLPTSPFYFLKQLKENVELIFAFSPEKKLEKRLEFATRRLAEANAVAKKHPQLAQKFMDRYQKQLQKVEDKAAALPAAGQMQALERINRAMARHAQVWRRLEDKLPPQAQKHVEKALQRSIRGHQKAIEAISKHIEKLPPEARQRIEKRRGHLEKELQVLESAASKAGQLKGKDLLRLRRMMHRKPRQQPKISPNKKPARRRTSPLRRLIKRRRPKAKNGNGVQSPPQKAAPANH